MKQLATLLNQLRASYQVYRNSHWMVSGNYGSHLLLERIYKETDQEIDSLAEMMVGTYGPEIIQDSGTNTSQWVRKFTIKGKPLQSSLRAAKAVQASISSAYSALEKRGELDPAWDDELTGLAKEKASHLYLLQQATQTPAPHAKKKGRKGARKRNPTSVHKLVRDALK